MSEVVSNESSNDLNVSPAWTEKFDLFTKIGAKEKFIYSATKSEEFKKLTFKERQKIAFNPFAFFFTGLYYFSKKMWCKGAFILGAMWLLSGLLTLVELAVGMVLPSVIYWIIPAVISSQLASYDYFKFKTENEIMWKGVPDIFTKPAGIVGFPLVGLLFLLLTSGVFSSSVPTCSSSEATSLVLDISKGELTKQVGAKVANAVNLSVTAIRTTATNDQSGSHECAAQLDMAGSNGTNSIPVTYTIEMTDNGEEFYINVFGL